MPEEIKTTEKSIRDILNLLFKHKWKIIPIFVIALSITTFIVMMQPDMYNSSAKIVVKPGQTNPFELVTGMSVPTEINTELDLLGSRGFAEAVIDTIGIDTILWVPGDEKDPLQIMTDLQEKIGININQDVTFESSVNMRENALKTFFNSFKIGVVPRTNIINLSYMARTPKLAQEILTEIINIYTEKHLEMNTTAVSLRFLSYETDKLSEQLSKSEDELRQFRREIDIVSLTEQQTMLLQRVNDLQINIEQTEVEMSASQAAIDEMKKSLELRDQLREEEVRLKSLAARLEILKKQYDETRVKLRLLNENEQGFIYLQRKVEMQSEKYRRYLASLEQARIAQTLENKGISNINIMQEPTFIIKSVSKERKKTLALGLFLGLALGVGFAFAIEFVNHSVKTVEDVKNKLLLQSITAIPPVKTGMVSRIIRKEGKSNKQLRVVSLSEMSKSVIAWLVFLKELRNCFENIKTQIFNSMKNTGKSSYIVGVTSCSRGEGVSTVAVGLAYVVSLFENENVLLVDSNLHHPDSDEVLGYNRPTGLYEMSVKEQIPRQDGDSGNSFLNPAMQNYIATVDGSKKVNKLLPSVERLNYKLIVLDLPSISEGISAVKSASQIDGIIFVIESEKVRREVVLNAKEKLEKSGAKILGVVLNKRRFYIPRWLYQRF